jgi:N-acetylglucosamine-6-phosphate deacetylase
MPPLAIYAERVLTPLEELLDAAILIENGRIAGVGSRRELGVPAGGKEYDARGMTIAPGFVDIHIHGAGGHDVMEATPEALNTVAATLARRGTTSFVATTVTANEEATCRSLEGIARYAASPHNRAPGRAEVLGVHLEGPFISGARCGVHPAGDIAAPSTKLLGRLFAAAGGYARILTLAPELPGAFDLIEQGRNAGLVVAMGHTDATYEQACAAIERGASHAVHVFNAMRPFSHRDTGVLGAVLTEPGVTAEVIADGVHVDDVAIRILLAAKGAGRVLLVSDGTAATEMPDGSYRLGTFEVTRAGGVCRNRQGRLAGSTLTLDRAVRHMVSLGVPLAEAVRMAASQPAERIGVADRKGALKAGADADLVVLTPNLEIARVMTRGMWLE